MTEQSAETLGSGEAAAGGAVTHPVWCDPDQCTVLAQLPAEWTAGGWGEHRSLSVAAHWGAAAYLTQPVAPWECSVHLKVEYDQAASTGTASFTLDASSPLLLMFRQHAATQQARYPSLMPPVAAPQVPAVDDPAADEYTMDITLRVRASREQLNVVFGELVVDDPTARRLSIEKLVAFAALQGLQLQPRPSVSLLGAVDADDPETVRHPTRTSTGRTEQ